jgi:hypothetical protein
VPAGILLLLFRTLAADRKSESFIAGAIRQQCFALAQNSRSWWQNFAENKTPVWVLGAASPGQLIMGTSLFIHSAQQPLPCQHIRQSNRKFLHFHYVGIERDLKLEKKIKNLINVFIF